VNKPIIVHLAIQRETVRSPSQRPRHARRRRSPPPPILSRSRRHRPHESRPTGQHGSAVRNHILISDFAAGARGHRCHPLDGTPGIGLDYYIGFQHASSDRRSMSVQGQAPPSASVDPMSGCLADGASETERVAEAPIAAVPSQCRTRHGSDIFLGCLNIRPAIVHEVGDVLL